MLHKKEREIFKEYIRNKGLRHSNQRMHVLETFLKNETHISADALYRLLRKKHPSIGIATVYRTIKLLCESGLCRELKLEDGTIKYEHLYGHEHHDHLICLKCGKYLEVVDPEIEKLQEKLARDNDFILKRHRLDMYGYCSKCKKMN